MNSTNNFAEISLELGGKSPVVVFDDANVESAVNAAAAGIFGASGQSCVAGSRLLLHEAIADEFLARLAEIARNIRLGDPALESTEMGPICTPGQMETIEREVERARREGATILHGGKRALTVGEMFYEPTIVCCPSPDLHIVDTELFGPVVSVLRFRDEDEAIRLANKTIHGLAAGIFTTSGARSLRVSRKIKAGIVWVNTYRAVSPIAEFGGLKTSGYGRESGFQAIYDYTRPKTVWMYTSDEPLCSQFVAR